MEAPPGEAMRIGLDVSPLVGTRAGVGIHVERLVNALIAASPQHRYYLYAPGPLPGSDVAAFEAFSNAKLLRCPAFLMGCRARWDGVDLFHGMNYKLRGWGRYGGGGGIYELALGRIPPPSPQLFRPHPFFLPSRRAALRAPRGVVGFPPTASGGSELYQMPPAPV